MFHVKHLRRGAPALIAALAILAVGCAAQRSPEGWTAPTAADDLVLTQDKAGRLVALQFDGGAVLERWRYEGPDDGNLDAIYAAPLLDGRTAYLSGHSGIIAAIDVRTGDPIAGWLDGADVKDAVVGAPALHGDALLIATDGGRLHLVDIETALVGDPLASAGGRIWATPVIFGGNAIVATLDGHLRAYDLDNGELRWGIDLGGGVPGDGALDGSTIYLGTLDDTLVSVDLAAGGGRNWTFEGDGWFWGHPQLTADRVFATTTGGTVYALDRANGGLDWAFAAAEGQFRTGVALLGGNVIAATELGYVYALDQATGALIWEQQLENAHILSEPLVRDGAVLLQSREGDLWRVQPDSGATAVIHERG